MFSGSEVPECTLDSEVLDLLDTNELDFEGIFLGSVLSGT